MEQYDLQKVLSTAPAYYHRYIVEARISNVIDSMTDQIDQAKSFFGKTMWEKRDYRYAEGKWTPTELLGHLADCERVFQYRAMRFARNDKTELPGFDENEYIAHTNFTKRGIDSLLEEFEHTRRSGIALFRSLTEEEKWRTGTANGNPISVIALFYCNVGHFNHHVQVIKERYLN